MTPAPSVMLHGSLGKFAMVRGYFRRHLCGKSPNPEYGPHRKAGRLFRTNHKPSRRSNTNQTLKFSLLVLVASHFNRPVPLPNQLSGNAYTFAIDVFNSDN